MSNNLDFVSRCPPPVWRRWRNQPADQITPRPLRPDRSRATKKTGNLCWFKLKQWIMNAKNILLVLAMWSGLFTSVDMTFAQTWAPASVPSNNWKIIASSADGSKLIAGAMLWAYCISTNSGTTWITKTQPQEGSLYGGWSCVASSADGTTLVGAVAGMIWVSTNSGTTWHSNNVPGVSFFDPWPYWRMEINW